MSDALTEREADIRHYLDGAGRDPVLARHYAMAAARWEQLRIAQARGTTTPGDSTRLRELAGIVRKLGVKLGLGSDITDSRGFLPLDPARILAKDWREHLDMYFG